MHQRAVTRMEMKVNLILSIMKGLLNSDLALSMDPQLEEFKNKYIQRIDELFSEYSGLFIQGQAYYLVNVMKEIEIKFFKRADINVVFIFNFFLDSCNKQLLFVKDDKRFELWSNLKIEIENDAIIKEIFEVVNHQLLGEFYFKANFVEEYKYLQDKIASLKL